MSIQAILCVNTCSQTHAEEAATRKHYASSYMTNSLCLLPIWQLLPQVWKHQSPPCGTQIFPHFRHEPEPYVRTSATNGDYDATAETLTAATATTAPG